MFTSRMVRARGRICTVCKLHPHSTETLTLLHVAITADVDLPVTVVVECVQ